MAVKTATPALDLTELQKERMVRVAKALLANPAGLTIPEMEQATTLTDPQVRTAIFYLRRFLGSQPDDSGHNRQLVCDPAGKCQPWVYRLLTAEQVIDPTVTQWTANRMGDLETRHVTMTSVATAAHRATKGQRTRQANVARILATHYQRALEDIEALDAQVPDLVSVA